MDEHGLACPNESSPVALDSIRLRVGVIPLTLSLIEFELFSDETNSQDSSHFIPLQTTMRMSGERRPPEDSMSFILLINSLRLTPIPIKIIVLLFSLYDLHHLDRPRHPRTTPR